MTVLPHDGVDNRMADFSSRAFSRKSATQETFTITEEIFLHTFSMLVSTTAWPISRLARSVANLPPRKHLPLRTKFSYTPFPCWRRQPHGRFLVSHVRSQICHPGNIYHYGRNFLTHLFHCLSLAERLLAHLPLQQQACFVDLLRVKGRSVDAGVITGKGSVFGGIGKSSSPPSMEWMKCSPV
jgi:hypothetical protein